MLNWFTVRKIRKIREEELEVVGLGIEKKRVDWLMGLKLKRRWSQRWRDKKKKQKGEFEDEDEENEDDWKREKGFEKLKSEVWVHVLRFSLLFFFLFWSSLHSSLPFLHLHLWLFLFSPVLIFLHLHFLITSSFFLLLRPSSF